jgi:hypothetical protein
MKTELFQDGGQIKREKVIYHHGPKHIPIICHLPDPPSFSLTTTFNDPFPTNLRIRILKLAKNVIFIHGLRNCKNRKMRSFGIISNKKFQDPD